MKKLLCMMLTVIMLLTGAGVFPASATETEAVAYTAPVFYGVQTAAGATANTQNIRFVSVVPNQNGTALGYKIVASYTDNGIQKTVTYSADQGDSAMESTFIYATVKSGNFGEVTAEELGAEKGIENPAGLFAVVLKNVPTNIGKIQFSVSAYVKDGEEIKASSVPVAFEAVDGVVVSDRYDAYIGRDYDLTAEYTWLKTMSTATATNVNGDRFSAVQGGCSDGTYYYYCAITADGNATRCVILKYDLATQEMVDTSDAMYLDHANDMAYNPDEDVLAVAHCAGETTHNGQAVSGKISILDPDTLTLLETVPLASLSEAKGGDISIAYDCVNKQYITISYQNRYMYVYDSDFNLQKTIEADFPECQGWFNGEYEGAYLVQGIETDGRYLYFLDWHGGSEFGDGYKSIEDEISTHMHVIDLQTGKQVELIELGIKREVENLAIMGDCFYIVCNNITWTGSECYKVRIIPESLKGELDDGTSDMPKYSWVTQGGDGTAESPYIINQTNFLDFYNYYIKGGWNGFYDPNEHFKLESDITVNQGNAANWASTDPAVTFNMPMNAFVGTFDGNGHTISGLCIKTNGERCSLFYELGAGANVKNLRITNSYYQVKGDGYYNTGSVAAMLEGGATVENCYSDAILEFAGSGASQNTYMGGIVGRSNRGNNVVKNCVFAGQVKGGKNPVGGIVGGQSGTWSGGSITLQNCLNLGSVKGYFAAGIIGYDENSIDTSGADTKVKIMNCINFSKEITRITDGWNSERRGNDLVGTNHQVASAINTYVITDVRPNAYSGGAVYGVADTVAPFTLCMMSLADFMALGGKANAPTGWYFYDGCLPCPIAGLEIDMTPYLNKWGITLGDITTSMEQYDESADPFVSDKESWT